MYMSEIVNTRLQGISDVDFGFEEWENVELWLSFIEQRVADQLTQGHIDLYMSFTEQFQIYW